MTKAKTKAALRRARRAQREAEAADAARAVGVPALLPSTPREPNGRFSRAVEGRRADPRKAALGARARQMGLLDTADNRRVADDARRGTEAGRALAVALAHGHFRDGAGDKSAKRSEHDLKAAERAEFDRRLDAFDGLARAQWAFHHLVLCCALTAQGAALPMMPEPLETRPDDRPDPRSLDERVADARAAWAAWRERLGRLHPVERAQLLAATRGDLEGLVETIPERVAVAAARPGRAEAERLTRRGEWIVGVLGRLADEVDRDRRQQRAEQRRARRDGKAGREK